MNDILRRLVFKGRIAPLLALKQCQLFTEVIPEGRNGALSRTYSVDPRPMAEEGAADPKPLGGTSRREAVLGKSAMMKCLWDGCDMRK